MVRHCDWCHKLFSQGGDGWVALEVLEQVKQVEAEAKEQLEQARKAAEKAEAEAHAMAAKLIDTRVAAARTEARGRVELAKKQAREIQSANNATPTPVDPQNLDKAVSLIVERIVSTYGRS
jgi:uncharacterized protein YqeY